MLKKSTTCYLCKCPSFSLKAFSVPYFHSMLLPITPSIHVTYIRIHWLPALQDHYPDKLVYCYRISLLCVTTQNMKESPSTQGEPSTSAEVYVFPVSSCYCSWISWTGFFLSVCLRMSHNLLFFSQVLHYLKFQQVTADCHVYHISFALLIFISKF